MSPLEADPPRSARNAIIQITLTFSLMPGTRDAFVDAFRRLRVLQTSSFQPGYRGAQLQVDLDDPDTAMVTAQWDSRAAYQGWLENRVRETFGEQLRPFLADQPSGHVYEVVLDVGPHSAAGSG